MKTKLLVLIVVGSAFCFLSCNKDSRGAEIEIPNEQPSEQPNEQPKIELKAYLDYYSGTKVSAMDFETTDSFFTGDDILSYNQTTGEIIFFDKRFHLFHEMVYKVGSLPRVMYLFLDDKPVFDPPIEIVNGYSSYSPGDFILCFSAEYHPGIFDDYMIQPCSFNLGMRRNGYQYFFHLSEEERAVLLKKQEEIYEKRLKELEVLIKYFRDEGKLVDYQ